MAGLALVGVAAVAPGAVAEAAPGNASRADGGRPPNFREGSFTPPAPGAHGPRFQSITDGPTPRIVGGTLADPREFPYLVGIVSYTPQGAGWCSGTIIAPNKVLTAAHCTVDVYAGTARVIAGASQLLDSTGNIPGGYVAEVASTWTHPGYNIAAQYNGTAEAILDDVSVLTLKQNLPTEYAPVTLSQQGDQTPYVAGTSAVIAGYGITDSYDAGDSRLRKATVPMQSNSVCDDVGAAYDPNRMICAGNGTPTLPSTDTCSGDSGGPLLVNGVQVGITDWGYGLCGEHPGYYERISYYRNSINGDLNSPPLINADWTGDGHADLIARDSYGRLRLYPGSGFVNDGYGGFWPSTVINSGWGGMKRIFRVYNWNGDNKPSIMAVNSAGELWLYNGDGRGGFSGAARKLGTGWGGFTALVPTNNWLGNGKPGLIARKSTGELIRYDGNGAGGWASTTGTKIGTGWNGFNLFLTPGAWKGDGLEALVVRKTTTGELFLFRSDGNGGWATTAGVKINSGWGSFKAILAPGDWSGNNRLDLLGVDSYGKLRIYPTDGYGNWTSGGAQQINAGWGSVSPIF